MSGEDDGELKRKYLRWSGELQEAYLDALQLCGGLHEARPKALLDMLSPRFPFLTLQAVKNHLQKQRTKVAKASGGARASGSRGGRTPSSLGAEDSEDIDQMLTSDEGGAAAAAAAAGGTSSPVRGGSQGRAPTATPPAWAAAAATDTAAALPARGGGESGVCAGVAGAAGPAHPSGWTVPLGDNSGVQPDSLLDLARRALALTLHQLGLYRKLLEELELNERDHAALVAALRDDPTGQSVVLGAQQAAAWGAHSSGSGASSAAEEGRPLRLRRLLARMLPPNPFSSGPRAEAALKMAAWIAGVCGDQPGPAVDAASRSAGSQPGPPPDLLQGLMQATRGAGTPAGVPPDLAASLLGALSGASGGQQPTSGAAHGGDEEALQLEREPNRQRRKRHKPLSELLAEIPLQEPAAAERLAVQPAVPSPLELQQLLGASPPVGADAAAHGAAADAGDPLGPALSLLLQQHLQGAPAVAQQGPTDIMDLDEDALMLRALDAQMSSLLLQSVSKALMRSAAEGDHAMDAAGGGGQPPAAAGFGAQPAAEPGGHEAALSLQATAAGLLQGDEPLPAGALDISVLRSFLDVLSSGGLAPGDAARGAAGAPPGGPQEGPPGGLPLWEGGANVSGSSGSHGSGGRIGGGAFSAFLPTGPGGGHASGPT